MTKNISLQSSCLAPLGLQEEAELQARQPVQTHGEAARDRLEMSTVDKPPQSCGGRLGAILKQGCKWATRAFCCLFCCASYGKAEANTTAQSQAVSDIHPSQSALSKQLGLALQVALAAGGEILKVREMVQKGEMNLQIQDKNKGDSSKTPAPVTIADLRSNAIICSALTKQFPEYGLLTEEAIDDPEVRNATIRWYEKEYVWMVDPLDGTAEFTKGGDGFGVHIALTKNGIPILGVNYYPVTQIAFWAVKGEGAYMQIKDGAPLRLKVPEKTGTRLPVRTGPVMKGEDIQKFYQAWFGKEMPLTQNEFEEGFKLIPSMGLVICTIAQGTRNIYANNVSSCGLWDFASGDLILSEVGGKITDKAGIPIDYRAPNAKLPNGVVITSSQELNDQAVATFKKQGAKSSQEKKES